MEDPYETGEFLVRYPALYLWCEGCNSYVPNFHKSFEEDLTSTERCLVCGRILKPTDVICMDGGLIQWR